ncbi:response regulator transcription factor [Candidatus Sulfurimonas baltica]|uniref:Response regulator transcription factor n=1 Tax=Candidatus Sulfurimonas baltica TaxID=2740404 RepID=A0A7S7LWL0_9BACT|nr:response regulator transcription factor [Candidatus Sulfurimonas baltica]QOY52757.1 response regulator transcription factor [Candidatus Sulfurimonas baltica]
MSENKFPYNILFVEDEDATRENYVRFLKKYYENVYEACDGEEAYKIYKDKKPHILIVDINIPKLSGINLLKKIRENDHSIKVIMLTAHSETHYLLEATELMLTKYLIKPITRDELKNALNLVLQELSKFTVSPKKLLILKDCFSWDYDLKELLCENKPVPLTNKERKILTILFLNINKTCDYYEIIYEVWYDYSDDKLDALKTIIKNLRKKLPKETIGNDFGVGYRLKI